MGTEQGKSISHTHVDFATDAPAICRRGKLANIFGSWNDFTRISVLVLITLALGIYMISRTVMISQDGVFYIERAQQLADNPVEIIKTHPPGYPFLILMGHKFLMLFGVTPSVFTWIYSAQSVSLLCRVLAIIPLYFIGKLLVGSKNSFWALLILIFLPYPAEFVCDVVREWPYLLFLATGFCFLLWAAKSGKWWAFGLVGLSSGLGYLIRPESVQLVVYALLWAAMSMLKPSLWKISRCKNVFALILLLGGFIIPAIPYMKCTGRIIPPTVKRITTSLSMNTQPCKNDTPKVNTVSLNYNTAEIIRGDVLDALGKISKTICENLMWIFIPALMIGLCYRFRNNAEYAEWFLITAFVLANITMATLRYCYIQEILSKRWTLPLITLTIFYIPVGLHIIGSWLESVFPLNKEREKKEWLSWFVILFFISIGVCLPKLLRPVRIEKQGYKDAAMWLRENSNPGDLVITPDSRIAFYAERKGLICTGTAPGQAKYIVKIVNDEDKGQMPKFDGAVRKFRELQERYSVWVDKRDEEGKKLVIYKVMQ